jgi:TetR/AcrR family transcriptional repressor of nem operon
MEPAEQLGDRAERSRRAILDAAGPIFAERGYEAASLNEIILASGLTKGGFYFHFRSKRALALAVIDDGNERWLKYIEREMRHASRAVDRLVAVPRAIARLARVGDGPAAYRRLADDLSRDPEVRDEVCGTIRTWIASAAADFAAAQEEGAVRADLDPDVLAEFVIAAFIGAQTLTEQFGDDGLERRIEAQIELLRPAVAAPSGRGEGSTA